MLEICDVWEEWYRVVSCEWWWFAEMVGLVGLGIRGRSEKNVMLSLGH